MSHEYDVKGLREQLEHGQLALFIGSDLQREVTGLPNRADLARDLARRHELDETLSLAETAQRVSQASNRWEFTAFIRDALDTTGKPPQAFHRRIVEWIEMYRIEIIITTAYDNLLELAFQEAGVGVNCIVQGGDTHFIHPDRSTLIKLYGDAQRPDTLVVTDSDHLNLLRDRDKEPLLEEVRRAFHRNTVFFLGYNLADPDFRFLFDQIAGSQFARTAYAVWPGLPEADVQMWRDRRIVILDQDPFDILDVVTTVDGSPALPVVSTEIAKGKASFTPPAPSAASDKPPEQVPPSPPTQQEPLPQIDSNVRLRKLEETVLQHTYPNCEQVLVVVELSGGFSGAQVLLTVPKPKKDGPPKPRKVTKLGSALEIGRERDKYAQYVEKDLPFCATRVEEDTYYEQEGLAGLNYVFVHDGITFEEHYRKALAEGDVERVRNVLEDLLNRKLGYRWYQHWDSTSVFFRAEYSRQLVENLRLRLRPGSHDSFWPLDQPPAEDIHTPVDLPLIHQQPESISSNSFVAIAGLIPTRIKQKEVTLEDIDGHGIVIGVEVPPQVGVPEWLDFNARVGVRGKVIWKRHDEMKRIVANVFHGLKPGLRRTGKGQFVQLPCGVGDELSRAYPNPLRVCTDVLKDTMETRLSTVHGDLNLRNILVDESGKGWLIDFAKVERRHNVFDFIKLEARLRTSELAREECAFSLGDYVAFEEALDEAILGNDPTLPTNKHLAFAYEVILTIRKIAKKYMGPNPDFRKEYFPALLLYCLGTMRYYRNDGKQSARLSFAAACVQGRYIRREDEQECSAVTDGSDKILEIGQKFEDLEGQKWQHLVVKSTRSISECEGWIHEIQPVPPRFQRSILSWVPGEFNPVSLEADTPKEIDLVWHSVHDPDFEDELRVASAKNRGQRHTDYCGESQDFIPLKKGSYLLTVLFRAKGYDDPFKRIYQLDWSGPKQWDRFRLVDVTDEQLSKEQGEFSTSTPALGVGRHWAVMVGINDYKDNPNFSDLTYSVADVQAVHRLLTGQAHRRYHTRLLLDITPDNLPTRNNVLAELDNVAKTADERDLLLFYFSGHGAVEAGEAYLIPRDARLTNLADTAIPLQRVKKIMSDSAARAKVIILDACHSGARVGKADARMSPAFIQRVFAEAEGLAILTSCQQGQVSYEWGQVGQSVFTHYLLEGLAGAADFSDKGFVTIQDINRYVTDKVKIWAVDHGCSQTPTLGGGWSGDIIVADYADKVPDQDSDVISTRPGLTVEQRQRLEQKYDVLRQDWDLRSEKARRLQTALAIEASVSVKFQVEQELADVKVQLARLEEEMANIETRLATASSDGEPSSTRSLKEDRIRLDVATPETVTVNQSFEIAVRISRPDSPPLSEADLPHVTFRPGRVYREHDQEVIRYRVKVSAPACEVHDSEYVFLLRPGMDSEVVSFHLTAKREGTISIIVTAYQADDLLAAQTRIQLVATLRAQSTPVTSSEWNIASVREKLNIFDDPDLEAFCLTHFPGVFGKFSAGMQRVAKITLLLDHCRKTPARRQRLLTALEREDA